MSIKKLESMINECKEAMDYWSEAYYKDSKHSIYNYWMIRKQTLEDVLEILKG